MSNFSTLLSLLALDSDELVVSQEVVETENEFIIYAKQKEPDMRVCPKCGSIHVVIKEHRMVTIKHSVIRFTVKQVLVVVTKTRYLCRDCNQSFTLPLNLVQKGKNISRFMEQYIYLETMEPVSFTSIARKLNISVSMVRNIFNEIVTVGRGALTTAISLDEKHFKTDFGKYILVISDPFKGKYIDIVISRRIEVLRDYFKKMGKIELNTVKFFTSDMYETYRTIKAEFFPDALHIVDHFHITRLFTNTIQTIRKECMRDEYKSSKEYKFLKTHWKLFLVNPYAKETTVLDKEVKEGNISKHITYEDLIKKTTYKYPKLNQIYSIYCDYCRYMQLGEDDEDLEKSLDFIINRCLNSTYEEIKTLGTTLLSFHKEILNYFTSANSYKLSNAVAEGLNNKIQKFIDVSYGLQDFPILKKRILHSNRKEDN